MNLLSALKALADENRLKIIVLLGRENFCVNALAHRLELSEAAVSQHLKVLRKADLVEGEKISYWVHYHVKEQNLNKIGLMLENLEDHIDVPVECQEDHEGDCCT